MKITVFCGSGSGKEDKYCICAQKIGRNIARKGHILIYGAGNSGLMGAVSAAAHSEKGYVIGVVPMNIPLLMKRDNSCVDHLIKTEDMRSRKKIMMELADAFIALPGGIGTLDEITEVMMFMRLGVFTKPCIFVNLDGFYDDLHRLFEKMIEADFLQNNNMKHILFSDNIKEINDFLDRYEKRNK